MKFTNKIYIYDEIIYASKEVCIIYVIKIIIIQID